MSDLSITAKDKEGRLFIFTMFDVKWVPMEKAHIGVDFVPRKLLRVDTDQGLLYHEPMPANFKSD